MTAPELRAFPVAVAVVAACMLMACRSTPTLDFLDEGDAATATDATVAGDANGTGATDGGVTDGGALADTMVDDDAFVFNDAADDGPTGSDVCPSANPPTGVTCCNAVPCIGVRCGIPARCAQCERKCGTSTYCCADLNPPSCAARPKGCLN